MTLFFLIIAIKEIMPTAPIAVIAVKPGLPLSEEPLSDELSSDGEVVGGGEALSTKIEPEYSVSYSSPHSEKIPGSEAETTVLVE